MVMTKDQEVTRGTLRALERQARRYHAANDKRTEARDALRDQVIAARSEGMSEVEMAKVCGVSRMTVRGWLGKEPWKPKAS
jgi:uncharacterized protein YjcR